MVKHLPSFGLKPSVAKTERGSRTDTEFHKERDRIRAANDEKTQRLRALRLEKEAAERQAAAEAAAANPVPLTRKARSTKTKRDRNE